MLNRNNALPMILLVLLFTVLLGCSSNTPDIIPSEEIADNYSSSNDVSTLNRQLIEYWDYDIIEQNTKKT